MKDYHFKKANEIKKQIKTIEDFLDWGFPWRERSPFSIIKLNRKGLYNYELQDISLRLQDKIYKCVKNELKLLEDEFSKL